MTLRDYNIGLLAILMNSFRTGPGNLLEPRILGHVVRNRVACAFGALSWEEAIKGFLEYLSPAFSLAKEPSVTGQILWAAEEIYDGKDGDFTFGATEISFECPPGGKTTVTFDSVLSPTGKIYCYR